MQKLFDWNNYCLKFHLKKMQKDSNNANNNKKKCRKKALTLKLNVCQSDILFADITYFIMKLM